MKRYLFLFTLLSLWVSCSKEDHSVNDVVSGSQVMISPTITKVTETHFEQGDAIGLTVIRESGIWEENAKLTFDGSVFTGNTKWYNGNDVSILKAYYPYSSTFPTSFTVSTDQTNGTSSSDFIASVKNNVKPTEEAVPMIFSHKLSRIVINVKNQSNDIIDGITLSGSIPTATINENFEVMVANASATDIKAYKVSDTVYHAITVPQTVAFTVKVSIGNIEQTSLLSSVNLQSGKEYNMNVLVLDSGIKIIVSGDINNWDKGEEIIGDGQLPVPTAVDLGLSVKWASFNLGASAPEDYGNYYAWAETEPKSDYDWSTYKWFDNSSSSLTKYNNNSSYGVVDNMTELKDYNYVDDAARVNLGGKWRIPSDEEFGELINNCSWEWTTINNVSGYKVTSNLSGHTDKWIFLPAGATRYQTGGGTVGSYGCFWATSIRTNNPQVAYHLYITPSQHQNGDDDNRFNGLSIRPVLPD